MPAPGPASVSKGSGRSKLAAAFIAIFLGGLGSHKFYLGQMGGGVVYLLFCWTLAPAIIAFFEGLGLMLRNQDTFDERYG